LRRRGEVPDPATSSIDITAWMMQPGDDKVVAERLFEVLSRKRNPKPAPAAPAADLGGRWDVEVTFFSSKSQHTLTLEQSGNRLHGLHKGDFSSRDIAGTIEGDQIKLQSTDSRPGDSITFTFAGTLSGETFSGPVYMGEYLNAKFTAKRHTYQERRGNILIPGGPPLAN
jgi:D-glucosaminate-6-phosphate ammonia-lyase